jgi:hypothetical protein
MKNQDQANKNNNLNEPAVANDPQTLVEDLPMSGEQEERVIGGSGVNYRHPDLYLNIWINS